MFRDYIQVFNFVPVKIKKIWTNFYPNSIGLFYSTITDYLGFEINEGEFKVMSLSSFGKPLYEIGTN